MIGTRLLRRSALAGQEPQLLAMTSKRLRSAPGENMGMSAPPLHPLCCAAGAFGIFFKMESNGCPRYENGEVRDCYVGEPCDSKALSSSQ